MPILAHWRCDSCSITLSAAPCSATPLAREQLLKLPHVSCMGRAGALQSDFQVVNTGLTAATSFTMSLNSIFS